MANGVKSEGVPRACDKNLIQDNQYNDKKSNAKRKYIEQLITIILTNASYHVHGKI